MFFDVSNGFYEHRRLHGSTEFFTDSLGLLGRNSIDDTIPQDKKKKRVKERFQQSGPLPATSGVMSFHSTYRGYNPCETYLFKRPFIGVY